MVVFEAFFALLMLIAFGLVTVSVNRDDRAWRVDDFKPGLMRRFRPDGSVEYRPMTEQEADEDARICAW